MFLVTKSLEYSGSNSDEKQLINILGINTNGSAIPCINPYLERA